MAHIIAVSTTDGKTIHQHFGRSKVFHIVSIDDAQYTYIETRNTDPCCHQFEHSESSFDKVLEVLHDCEAVVVGMIGPGATEYLISKGIRVFETSGYVDEVLNELSRNKSHYFSKKD